MADIAHISGLVAAGEAANAFDYCDVVTTTTHKTLRGPRAGLIFFKRAPKGEKYSDLEGRINFAVFPSNQGGPHNHCIAAIAVALKQAASPEFKLYAKQVVANCKVLGETLISKGYKLQTDGTDNHLLLWDLRPLGLTGSKLEKLCDFLSITLNKNAVCGDVSALTPGGVRIGAPALTSRSFKEDDFKKVAGYLDKAVKIALRIQNECGSKLLRDFAACAAKDVEVKVLLFNISRM